MNDLKQAAETVASLMKIVTSTGGLQLRYRITAGAGAADPDGFEQRDIYVECSGPDTDLLLENNSELLLSLEHVAAKMLRLEPGEHDRVSFDADGFKASRIASIRSLTEDAIDRVNSSGEPFRFRPMSSHERRMVHLFLHDSGLQTASSGEGPRRYVTLYPAGYRIPQERPSDAQDRRHSPRRRPARRDADFNR